MQAPLRPNSFYDSPPREANRSRGDGDRRITGEAQAADDARLEYTRLDDGWDGFRRARGQTIQLGPDFPPGYTVCAKCDRRIELRGRTPGNSR